MDFQQDVIEKSHELPVLVDFWAAWCGPCQILGPVIEEVAREAEGQFELVKVDTEAHQAVASSYQVMSIPNVKLFHQGEPIAEFTGALPKHQIQRWLAEHLPNPAREALQVAINALRSKPSQANLDALLAKLSDANGLEEAALWAKWMQAIHQPEAVKDGISPIRPGHLQYAMAEDIMSIIQLMTTSANGKLATIWAQAQAKLAAWDLDAALEALIKAIMIDKHFEKELARKAAISLFHFLGEQHPLSKKHRPLFNMALY